MAGMGTRRASGAAMAHWIRFGHAGTEGFGTLDPASGRIDVQKGGLFARPVSTVRGRRDAGEGETAKADPGYTCVSDVTAPDILHAELGILNARLKRRRSGPARQALRSALRPEPPSSGG